MCENAELFVKIVQPEAALAPGSCPSRSSLGHQVEARGPWIAGKKIPFCVHTSWTGSWAEGPRAVWDDKAGKMLLLLSSNPQGCMKKVIKWRPRVCTWGKFLFGEALGVCLLWGFLLMKDLIPGLKEEPQQPSLSLSRVKKVKCILLRIREQARRARGLWQRGPGMHVEELGCLIIDHHFLLKSMP